MPASHQAEARDGDALVHVGSSWVHRPVSDTLKLCEDDVGGNIDQIYLVVSDHDRKVSLSGSVEASAKEDCSVATGIVGDITWDEQVVTDPSLTNGVDITDKTSGSAHIHALWDETAGWQIQNDSRFTMHYEITNCSPTADFAGPLTQVDSLSSPADGTGTVSVQGGPQQDLSIVLDDQRQLDRVVRLRDRARRTGRDSTPATGSRAAISIRGQLHFGTAPRLSTSCAANPVRTCSGRRTR